MRRQIKRRLSSESSPRAGDQGHFAFQEDVHFDFELAFFFGLPTAVSK
jgi:hypothetical protein